MAVDNAKNFSKVTVSALYDDAATSVVLSGGHGALLPTVPFNVVWWNSTDYPDPSDDPNKEIVRVTAIATDTLTVTRAQEGIAASTKNAAGKTYKMIAGLTAKVINDDLMPRATGTTDSFARWKATAPYLEATSVLFQNGADTVEQYNGSLFQTFNLYGFRTDASDYTRLRIRHNSTSQIQFVSEAAGSGAARDFYFIGGSVNTGLLYSSVADALPGVNFAAASGMARFWGYIDAARGTLIDATNLAGTVYQRLTINGSDLKFQTGAVDRMRIDSTGNMGIGLAPISDERMTVRSATSDSGSYVFDFQRADGFTLAFLRSDGLYELRTDILFNGALGVASQSSGAEMRFALGGGTGDITLSTLLGSSRNIVLTPVSPGIIKFNRAAVVTPVALTDGANIATDAGKGNLFRVTLAGNRTLDNPTALVDGGIYTWEFTQDATGSRTITLGSAFALGTDIASVVLTTTASKRDFMRCVYNAAAGKLYVFDFKKGY